MGRKAGFWVAAAAVAVTASGTAAVVFGAGASGPATIKRPNAVHMRAHIMAPAGARAASATATRKHKPPVVYGVTKPRTVPNGTSSELAIGGCPRRYHVTNGAVATNLPAQSPNLVINGSGPLPNKRGVVKAWFTDFTNTNTNAAIQIQVFASIVCQR